MRVLDTPRLHLRPLGPGDEGLYCRIYTDPTLMRHVGEPLSVDAAQRSLRRALDSSPAHPSRWRFWVMSEKCSGADVGFVALVNDGGGWSVTGAEIGAMVLEQWHRRGYAFEALAALVEHAFVDLELPALHGQHPSGNERSTGVMRKLGFFAVPPDISSGYDRRWLLPRAHWVECRRMAQER